MYPEEYTTLELAVGETWKQLRKGMSPPFTSGKVKSMLEPIAGETDRLIRHLSYRIQNTEGSVNVRDILQAFTMDVIGKCAYNVEFGCLKEDSLENPKILNDLKAYFGNVSSNCCTLHKEP